MLSVWSVWDIEKKLCIPSCEALIAVTSFFSEISVSGKIFVQLQSDFVFWPQKNHKIVIKSPEKSIQACAIYHTCRSVFYTRILQLNCPTFFSKGQVSCACCIHFICLSHRQSKVNLNTLEFPCRHFQAQFCIFYPGIDSCCNFWGDSQKPYC